MTKILYVIAIIGLCLTCYYAFQWWQGGQAVEAISIEEINSLENDKNNRVDMETDDVGHTMSQDMDRFEPGEGIGRLVVPAMEKGYKTYWGADDDTLDQGVGMYISEWTATPDQMRHTVLSGHRDTVFTDLDQLEIGDTLLLEFEDKRYEYEIDEIWITSAEDRTVIVDKDTPTLTLTTCYPFDFIGSAPDRYIIQAQLNYVYEK